MKGSDRPEDPFVSLTDEILFARFKNGDHPAFDALLARHQGLVFSFILKSVHDRPRAEDLFQEVFAKVIEKRDQFQPTVSFKAWLMTVCRNTVIDSVRYHKRRPQGDSLYEHEDRPLELKVAVDAPLPDQQVGDSEMNSLLNAVLNELPAEQKETFYLKVYEDLTFEEIGEVMKCSTNTAKSRMRYALETLRGILRKRKILIREES